MFLKADAIPYLKMVAPFIVETQEEGACLVITDREKIVYKCASSGFDISVFKEGDYIRGEEVFSRIMKGKGIVKFSVGGKQYGLREAGMNINITGTPIVDEKGEIAGAFVVFAANPHPVYKSFAVLSEVIDQALDKRINFVLADTEEIVATTKALSTVYSHVSGLRPGTKLFPDGSIKQSILQNRMVREEASYTRDMLGVAFEFTSFPLRSEKGEVVGAFCSVIDRTINEDVKGHVKSLEESINQITIAIESVVKAISEVVEQQNHLNEKVQEIGEASDKIEGILKFIKEVAEETKMLGLNAAIEAARAGEVGKGFSVVANEIRKLSEQSKETVNRIKGFISHINNQIKEAASAADYTLSTAENQAAAIEEINASIEEINALAEVLAKEVQNL
ncbi:Methyl-accepting chemotaxis protein (MCP) signalling domain-containing protein [Thermosyntropha lipolytica DSM 11003]|uniref:Methyl-accepting chemotaxis protein (MCP) signalling domain-containing protein n=1 Tax=Thermosyntropha lipolytica DSM 11003 TaxID=1123382 RepID=A0A1M5PU95_9FIRM|nr:methyl-accepting chemotaxis protein [Thermosyntropha lipolytica]SHH05464.1 Methyl-accepting chemotaxis protein (MCP) signalling domain-containing protein [Thermosyntropha lipolytica DSM 11003]